MDLNILNSLTNQKEKFIPNRKNISVYICGSTVYDISHLGHARTYMCFDLIKRIMKNFFNYQITHVMNITDIDDKIIKKSNEEG